MIIIMLKYFPWEPLKHSFALAVSTVMYQHEWPDTVQSCLREMNSHVKKWHCPTERVKEKKKVEHMKWKLQHTNVISAQLASASQLRSYEEMNYPSLRVKTCATTSTSLTAEQVQTHFMLSITWGQCWDRHAEAWRRNVQLPRSLFKLTML